MPVVGVEGERATASRRDGWRLTPSDSSLYDLHRTTGDESRRMCPLSAKIAQRELGVLSDRRRSKQDSSGAGWDQSC